MGLGDQFQQMAGGLAAIEALHHIQDNQTLIANELSFCRFFHGVPDAQ
jgi:hypothetical protein